MSMPPSALLGRLQAFLPELEEANRTTEKLAMEGKLEVLDTNLEVADTEQQKEEAEATDEEGEDGEEAEETGEEDEKSPPSKTIQLDFALGDFDNTTIAQMEEEDEAEAEAGLGKGAEGAAGIDDAEDNEQETSGLAKLLRVTPADAKPRQKPKKPLIEEL